MAEQTWKHTNAKILPSIVFIIVGLFLSSKYRGIKQGSTDHKILAVTGVVIFALSAVLFLRILTSDIRKTMVSNRLGVSRSSAIQFVLRLIGYLVILFIGLDRLGIAVGHILLGSAVLGIIIGVAAQQALGNFFASIVLIASHPFSVGQEVTLTSGSLGGSYTGKVIDIGITHTRIRQEDGSIIALPNSTLLTGATIKKIQLPK
jgi:small-conductance mechanosensitive channel